MSASAKPATRLPFPYPVAGRAGGAVRLVVGNHRAGWIDAVPGDIPGLRVLAVTCGSAARPSGDGAAGVRALLARELDLGEFDLVYATGVCEHLARPVAHALAERLFDHLAPGGRLVLPGPLPGADGAECRGGCDEAEMAALASGIAAHRIGRMRMHRDGPRRAVVLEMVRARQGPAGGWPAD